MRLTGAQLMKAAFLTERARCSFPESERLAREDFKVAVSAPNPDTGCCALLLPVNDSEFDGPVGVELLVWPDGTAPGEDAIEVLSREVVGERAHDGRGAIGAANAASPAGRAPRPSLSEAAA